MLAAKQGFMREDNGNARKESRNNVCEGENIRTGKKIRLRFHATDCLVWYRLGQSVLIAVRTVGCGKEASTTIGALTPQEAGASLFAGNGSLRRNRCDILGTNASRGSPLAPIVDSCVRRARDLGTGYSTAKSAGK